MSQKVNQLQCPQENVVQVQEGWLPPLLKAVTEDSTTIASPVNTLPCIIRSSWPINIIIIFVPTPPPPPTTIASTVTLGHVGLYHYRICWHSPHNSIFSSTTSLPSEECYREPNDHRLSSKFSSHYLDNLTILTTILTTTSSRLSKVYPLYHPYFRPTFCSESRQPIPIAFLPSLTTYRHTCKCLSREKQLLFYLTTISLFAF